MFDLPLRILVPAHGDAKSASSSWRLSMSWTMTTSVDDEDPFNEGQKYVSTKTAYPIRIGIYGRDVLSHVFRICTDYGSVNSRNRLLKYLEHFQRETMTRGTKMKWKRCSLFATEIIVDWKRSSDSLRHLFVNISSSSNRTFKRTFVCEPRETWGWSRNSWAES